jgi:hypothetical protein
MVPLIDWINRRYVIRSSDDTYQCNSIHLMCHVLRHAGATSSSLPDNDDNNNDNDNDRDEEKKESKISLVGTASMSSKSKKTTATPEAFGVTVTQVAIIQLLAQLLPILCRDGVAIIIAALRPDNTGIHMSYGTRVSYHLCDPSITI